MLSRQLRWPMTYKLIPQPCRSCELKANTTTATLKPKHCSYVKYSIFNCILMDDSAMANLLNKHVVDYPDTTGNNSVSRTPPRVTPLVPKDIFFVSNQQSYTRLRSWMYFVPSCNVAMLHARSNVLHLFLCFQKHEGSNAAFTCFNASCLCVLCSVLGASYLYCPIVP